MGGALRPGFRLRLVLNRSSLPLDTTHADTTSIVRGMSVENAVEPHQRRDHERQHDGEADGESEHRDGRAGRRAQGERTALRAKQHGRLGVKPPRQDGHHLGASRQAHAPPRTPGA